MNSPGIVFALMLFGIGSMISAIVSVLTYLKANSTYQRIEELEENTNSKMDAFLTLTAKSSKSEGKREAEDEAELRQNL